MVEAHRGGSGGLASIADPLRLSTHRGTGESESRLFCTNLPVFDISTLEARTTPTSWREREYCRAAAMTFIGLLPLADYSFRIVAAVNDEICVATCTRFPLPGAIQRK